jgi:hypothetical protein
MMMTIREWSGRATAASNGYASCECFLGEWDGFGAVSVEALV